MRNFFHLGLSIPFSQTAHYWLRCTNKDLFRRDLGAWSDFRGKAGLQGPVECMLSTKLRRRPRLLLFGDLAGLKGLHNSVSHFLLPEGLHCTPAQRLLQAGRLCSCGWKSCLEPAPISLISFLTQTSQLPLTKLGCSPGFSCQVALSSLSCLTLGHQLARGRPAHMWDLHPEPSCLPTFDNSQGGERKPLSPLLPGLTAPFPWLIFHRGCR